MYVIAKMIVTAVEDYGYSRKLKLGCVHDKDLNIGDTPENKAFSKASPGGEMWMTVDNKYVWPAFAPPKESTPEAYAAAQHYVLFINAKEHSLEDVYRAIAALEPVTVDN